jgi:hypothetical protein
MTDEQITDNGQEQDGQLGYIVSWRVPAEISVSDLRTALAAAGLPEALACDMALRNALSRALRNMSKNRVIRKLQQHGDLLTFQMNQEQKQGNHIEFPHEADVTLNLQTGEITCDDDSIKTAAEQLMQEHLQKRITSDLTRLVQRVFDDRAGDLIPIRDQGGAYFVPDCHKDLVTSVRTLLKEIGGVMRSFAVRLGSADTSASVAESMMEYLQQLIEEFRASCENVTKATRADVKTRRTEYVGELRHKLELYSGLMAGYSQQVQAEIDAAEQQLLLALNTEDEPAQAADVAPLPF